MSNAYSTLVALPSIAGGFGRPICLMMSTSSFLDALLHEPAQPTLCPRARPELTETEGTALQEANLDYLQALLSTRSTI